VLLFIAFYDYIFLMNREMKNLRLMYFFSLFFFLFFLSCQTAPKVPGTSVMETIPLNSGAFVYIIANAKQARPIIELLPIEELNNKQTRQILGRTDSFAAALFRSSDGQQFQIAAWGNYPSFRAGLVFGARRQWKKQRSQGHSYWHSAISRLSVALNSRQVFAADSPAGPVNPVTVTGGVRIPEGFYEFSRGYPLSCWLENPGPVISQLLNDAGIPLRFPVQQLFCNLYPVYGNQYEASLRLQFQNAVQARGMAAILTLAGGLSNEDASIIALLFLANPPVVNGSNLDIKTAPLSGNDIARLLQ
jgi:hypothetical protein